MLFFSLGILELSVTVLASSNVTYLTKFWIEFWVLAYSLEGLEKHNLNSCLALGPA